MTYLSIVNKRACSDLLRNEATRARTNVNSDYLQSMLELHAAARLATELGLQCEQDIKEKLDSAYTHSGAASIGYHCMDAWAVPLHASSVDDLCGIFDDAYNAAKRGEHLGNALMLMHGAHITALKERMECEQIMRRKIMQFYAQANAKTIGESILPQHDSATYASLRKKLEEFLEDTDLKS